MAGGVALAASLLPARSALRQAVKRRVDENRDTNQGSRFAGKCGCSEGR
jgi:hypothetical protein